MVTACGYENHSLQTTEDHSLMREDPLLMGFPGYRGEERIDPDIIKLTLLFFCVGKQSLFRGSIFLMW